MAKSLNIDEAVLFDNDKYKSAKVKVLSLLIEELLGEKPIREKSWAWLINPKTNKRMYVDLYLPKRKLAIEYDGEQHFEYTPYYHDSYNDFLNGQERDMVKENLLTEHNKKVVRFNYLDKLTTELVGERILY